MNSRTTKYMFIFVFSSLLNKEKLLHLRRKTSCSLQSDCVTAEFLYINKIQQRLFRKWKDLLNNGKVSDSKQI